MTEKKMKSNDNIDGSVTITNTGKYDVEEIVQMYLRDRVCSIVRPVKDLM